MRARARARTHEFRITKLYYRIIYGGTTP